MKHLKKLIATSTIALTATGCVTTGNNSPSNSSYSNNKGVCDYSPNAFVLGGAIVGGILGWVVGGNNNKTGGTLIGTAVGGLIGKAVESHFEERCKKLALAQNQMRVTKIKGKQISVSPTSTWQNPDSQDKGEKVEGLAVEIDSNQMFAVGRSALTPTAEKDIRELAQAFKGSSNKILIVGHTDSTGSTEQNQALSERRAQYVADIFKQEGVTESALFFKGAGETDPVASNNDEIGRAKNRRVEVVELPHKEAIVAYEFQRDNEISPNSNGIAPPPPPPAIALTEAPKYAGIDFGGTLASTKMKNVQAQVGKLESESGFFNFSLISSAYGNSDSSQALNASCISTRFRKKGEIKTLSDGSGLTAHKVSDHLPGLYGTSWVDQNVNGHLVGLSKVSVLRDSGIVPEDPTVFVYENFKPGDEKPSLKADGKAEATVGEKGVLYRTFFSKQAAPLICMDVVFSLKDKGHSSFGKLFYAKNGDIYAADFKPEIIKK
ncbi:OmpA family protein [Terasakiella sp.]|uniref:OmpA family protein n=1 Tax=Terasakiella sp. TaxID=2034861 RepID=UPI003AA83103